MRESKRPPVEAERERGERVRKKRACPLCRRGIEEVDYKDMGLIQEFLTGKASIAPRRRTGTCAAHQRSLARAVKNARELALLPFTADHSLTWRERR